MLFYSLLLISLCTAVLPVNFSQGGSIKEHLILSLLIVALAAVHIIACSVAGGDQNSIAAQQPFKWHHYIQLFFFPQICDRANIGQHLSSKCPCNYSSFAILNSWFDSCTAISFTLPVDFYSLFVNQLVFMTSHIMFFFFFYYRWVFQSSQFYNYNKTSGANACFHHVLEMQLLCCKVVHLHTQ